MASPMYRQLAVGSAPGRLQPAAAMCAHATARMRALCLHVSCFVLASFRHRCILDPGDCSVEVLTMGKLMANTNAGVKS